MNDHNLDDLIIDNIEPKQNQKAKSFLTIIALAIVVLIVAIILTKILLNDPNEDRQLIEENETVLISPDLTLQSVTQPQEEIAEPSMETTTETVEEKIEEAVSVPTPQTTPEAVDTEPTVLETPQIEPEAKESELMPAIEPEPSKPEPVSEPEPAKTEPVTEKQVSTPVPEPIIEKAIEKPTPRPANVLTRPGETSSVTQTYGSVYIQVGAFQSEPSRQFLNSISQKGFSYKVTQGGSTKKVLVGPYPNRAAAERALPEVRSRINKSAFIKK